MDAPTARRTLALGRLAIGVASVVAPRVAARFIGIRPEQNRAAPYLIRLFGVREIVMATPFLMPAPGLDEQELAARNVPVDATDAIASLLAGMRGAIPWPAALLWSATGAAGAYLGTIAAQEE